MNSTKTPLNNIKNYVKLNNIVVNTTKELTKDKTIYSKDNRFRSMDDYIKLLAGFNSLIATGYYQIAYIKNNDMIKTNFDYTGSNTDVILDFNIENYKKLINTEVNSKSDDEQRRLI